MQVGFPKPLRFENPLQKGKRIISGWLKFKFQSRFKRLIAVVLAILVAIPAGWALADVILAEGDAISGPATGTTIGSVEPGATVTPKPNVNFDL